MILWECDRCNVEFKTSAKQGVEIKCPICGATEQDKSPIDGFSCLEIIDVNMEDE